MGVWLQGGDPCGAGYVAARWACSWSLREGVAGPLSGKGAASHPRRGSTAA